MVIIAESDESKRIRGIILADCTTIDMELSRFLSDYFGETKDKKQELFNLVFNTDFFNFHKKIEILKRIVNNDFWSDSDALIEALSWLRKTRNQLAHWLWNFSKSQDEFSFLKNPKKNDFIRIDNALLKEHEEKFMKILEFFNA